jgi:hypothetical protein
VAEQTTYGRCVDYLLLSPTDNLPTTDTVVVEHSYKTLAKLLTRKRGGQDKWRSDRPQPRCHSGSSHPEDPESSRGTFFCAEGPSEDTAVEAGRIHAFSSRMMNRRLRAWWPTAISIPPRTWRGSSQERFSFPNTVDMEGPWTSRVPWPAAMRLESSKRRARVRRSTELFVPLLQDVKLKLDAEAMDVSLRSWD